MSLSFQPLEPVLVKDPRVIVDNKRVYSILKCGKETNFKKWTTNSVSNSNINFSTPPPSAGIIIDRKITLTLPMQLTLQFSVPNIINTLSVEPNFFAPRAFPIHSMLNTVQLTINNCSITQNIGEIIHSLLRYNTFLDLLATEYSETPACLDSYMSYEDGIGANDNPLGVSRNKTFFGIAPRGGFSYFRVARNDIATANAAGSTIRTVVVDMVCTEQIMMSPLYWGKENASGFTNVVSMDWVFNFLSNPAIKAISYAKREIEPGRFVEFSSGSIKFSAFNSFTYGTFSQPLLNITYITPESMTAVAPNTPITYPYFSIDRFVKVNTSSVPYGTSFTIASDNIQLSSIPRRVYVYARPENEQYYNNPNITDCYYGLTKINVQFGNRTGIFAEADINRLYDISKKNHCSLSFSDWTGQPTQNTFIIGNVTPAQLFGTVGSVFCFEMATDIGLDPMLAPGLGQGSYNLQINAEFINHNSSGNWNTYLPALYIIPVYEGSFTITGLGSAMTQTSVISFEDIASAQRNPMYNYKDVQEVNGGNFMTGLKNLVPRLKQANQFLKDNKVISRAANAASYIPGAVGDIARDVSSAATKFGYGYDYEGGVVLGGAKMSKKQLQNRLKNR